MIDRIRPQAQLKQLSSSYHAVLLLRQARDRLIVTTLSFAAYFAVKVILVVHALKRRQQRVVHLREVPEGGPCGRSAPRIGTVLARGVPEYAATSAAASLALRDAAWGRLERGEAVSTRVRCVVPVSLPRRFHEFQSRCLPNAATADGSACEATYGDGRCPARTGDLLLVRQALYQLS